MKRSLITIISLCFTIYLFGQTVTEDYQAIKADLTQIFRGLNKYRIPTGILLDYGVDLVEFGNYAGTALTDENRTDIFIYKDILKSISSCEVTSNSSPNFDEIFDSLQSDTENVNISFAAFKYNFIKENALEDNLIRYNEATGAVSDNTINGQWQNPYSEATIVAFSPCVNSYNSLSITYKFPASYLYSNLSIRKIEFDAGDGSGYHNIVENSSITVTYDTYGEYDLKVKIQTTSGQTYVAHSYIEIIETGPIYTKGESIREPDVTYTRETTYNTTSGQNDTIINVRARISHYYKSGSTSISRPFIVAEGFDPWILKYIQGDIPQESVHLGFTNHIDFQKDTWSKETFKNDYDLIYIDWDNSLADIRANAKLLIEIIEEINLMKAMSGSTEKNVIMGQSMGGLITRYALRKMEVEGKDHETATFISHDSPHLGANIPLGVLYFIKQALCFAHGYDIIIDIFDLFNDKMLTTAEKRFCNVVNSQSAKQMLIHDTYDYGASGNSIHSSWIEELAALGFPQNTENLAIVNGRQFDRAPTLTPGSHLLVADGRITYSFLTSFLASFLVRNIFALFVRPTKIDMHAEVNPLSSANIGKPLSQLKVTFTKKFLWLFDKTYTLFSSTINMPAGLYYDDYPGSQFIIDEAHTNDTLSGSNAWGEYLIEYHMANRIMFIPTKSALAITEFGPYEEPNYTRDFFTNRPTPETETPFDSYYLSPYATGHISLSPDISDWLDHQLSAQIEGPDTLLSATATYTAHNFQGDIVWKCSNESIATIDNNGKLTASDKGIVTITAESYSNGKLLRRTKDVMIGFPDITITYSFSPGEGHVFYATTPDIYDADELHDMVDAGYLKYEWSILCDEDDLVTEINTKHSIRHLPMKDETVTVCLRLIDANGNKGELYSRTVNLKNPFSTNYLYVEIDQYENVKFIKTNGYETGMPSEDFTISFRNIIYTPNDYTYNVAAKYLKGNTCYLANSSSFGTTYLRGTRVGLQHVWIFDFFDESRFIVPLNNMIEYIASGVAIPGYMIDFGLYICNHEKEFMQAIPFAIIYKPQ